MSRTPTVTELERRRDRAERTMLKARSRWEEWDQRYQIRKEAFQDLLSTQRGRESTPRDRVALQAARRRIEEAREGKVAAADAHSRATATFLEASRAYARALEIRELDS